MKNSFSSPVKSVSFFLLASFIVQQVAWSAPGAVSAPVFPVKISVPNFSEATALVEDRFPGDSGLSVYLIQTAHTNDSAQKNIAKIAEELYQQEKVSTIYVEGGMGDASLAFLRPEASVEKRREVAHSFLMQGELNGIEYLDLASDLPLRVWGVEDKGLYLKAVQAYAAVAHSREGYRSMLGRMRTAAEALKATRYNQSLLEFDRLRQKHHSQKMTTADYFSALTSLSPKFGIELRYYPQLSQLSGISELEKTIDFQKAQSEQLEAFGALTDLEKAEMLDGESGAPNKDPQDIKRQHAVIAFLAAKNNQFRDFPELAKYHDYLSRLRDLDSARAVGEMDILEREIYRKLFRSPKEEEFFRADEAVRLISKMAELTMTPDEFSAYRNYFNNQSKASLAGYLNNAIAESNQDFDKIVFWEQDFEDFARQAEEFYELTFKRDQVFVQKILEDMRRSGQKKAALLVGGYHGPNLKRLLLDEGVAYASIQPQVTKPTNLKRYEKILLERSQAVEAIRISSDSQNEVLAARQYPALVDRIGGRLAAQRGTTRMASPAAVPAIPATLRKQPAGAGARLAELEARLREMADQAGLTPGVLRDPKSLETAVDVYNARVSSLNELITDGTLKMPKPIAILATATREQKIEFLRQIAQGKLNHVFFSGGRATRLSLPKKFDQLGIIGLTPSILKRLADLRERLRVERASELANLDTTAKVDAQLDQWVKAESAKDTEFDRLIKKAAEGKDPNDLSLAQRMIIQYRLDLADLVNEVPDSGVTLEAALAGSNYTVVLNESNVHAVSNQFAAIQFGGIPNDRFLINEQPEEGGLKINPDGSLEWYDAQRWPEGHGKPYLDMKNNPGVSFQVSKTGELSPLGRTILEVYKERGIQVSLFVQTNDLHLLRRMAPVERWALAQKLIAAGSEMVVEGVANTIKQKGGGVFERPDGGISMRDTQAMKTNVLLQFAIPRSISRMFYFIATSTFDKLNADTFPEYIAVRKADDGSTVITHEFFSGDATSAANQSKIIEQAGMELDTIKIQSRIPVALEILAAQDARSDFADTARLLTGARLSETSKFRTIKTEAVNSVEGLQVATLNSNDFAQYDALFGVGRNAAASYLLLSQTNSRGAVEPIALMRQESGSYYFITRPLAQDLAAYHRAVMGYLHDRAHRDSAGASGSLLQWIDDGNESLLLGYLRGRSQEYQKTDHPHVQTSPFADEGLVGERSLAGQTADFQLSYGVTGSAQRTVIMPIQAADPRNGMPTLAFSVLPKKTILIAGVGLISSEVMLGLKAAGIQVVAANRSEERAQSAALAGIPVYLLESGQRGNFSDAFPVAGDLNALAESGVVDGVIEGFDGKTADPANEAKQITISQLMLRTVLKPFVDRGVFVLGQGASGFKKEKGGTIVNPVLLHMTGIPFGVAHPDEVINMVLSCNGTTTTGILAALLKAVNAFKADGQNLSIEQLLYIYNRRAGDHPQNVAGKAAKPDLEEHHTAGDIVKMLDVLKSVLPGDFANKIEISLEDGESFQTFQTMHPHNFYHRVAVTIKARKPDGTYLTANELKPYLQQTPNLAVVSVPDFIELEENGRGLIARELKTKAVDKLTGYIVNTLKFKEPAITPVVVQDLPDGKGVAIGALTFQRANVVPMNLAVAALRLGLFAPDNQGVKNALDWAMNIVGMDRMKENLENGFYGDPEIKGARLSLVPGLPSSGFSRVFAGAGNTHLYSGADRSAFFDPRQMTAEAVAGQLRQWQEWGYITKQVTIGHRGSEVTFQEKGDGYREKHDYPARVGANSVSGLVDAINAINGNGARLTQTAPLDLDQSLETLRSMLNQKVANVEKEGPVSVVMGQDVIKIQNTSQIPAAIERVTAFAESKSFLASGDGQLITIKVEGSRLALSAALKVEGTSVLDGVVVGGGVYEQLKNYNWGEGSGLYFTVEELRLSPNRFQFVVDVRGSVTDSNPGRLAFNVYAPVDPNTWASIQKDPNKDAQLLRAFYDMTQFFGDISLSLKDQEKLAKLFIEQAEQFPPFVPFRGAPLRDVSQLTPGSVVHDGLGRIRYYVADQIGMIAPQVPGEPNLFTPESISRSEWYGSLPLSQTDIRVNDTAPIWTAKTPDGWYVLSAQSLAGEAANRLFSGLVALASDSKSGVKFGQAGELGVYLIQVEKDSVGLPARLKSVQMGHRLFTIDGDTGLILTVPNLEQILRETYDPRYLIYPRAFELFNEMYAERLASGARLADGAGRDQASLEANLNQVLGVSESIDVYTVIEETDTFIGVYNGTNIQSISKQLGKLGVEEPYDVAATDGRAYIKTGSRLSAVRSGSDEGGLFIASMSGRAKIYLVDGQGAPTRTADDVASVLNQWIKDRLLPQTVKISTNLTLLSVNGRLFSVSDVSQIARAINGESLPPTLASSSDSETGNADYLRRIAMGEGRTPLTDSAVSPGMASTLLQDAARTQGARLNSISNKDIRIIGPIGVDAARSSITFQYAGEVSPLKMDELKRVVVGAENEYRRANGLLEKLGLVSVRTANLMVNNSPRLETIRPGEFGSAVFAAQSPTRFDVRYFGNELWVNEMRVVDIDAAASISDVLTEIGTVIPRIQMQYDATRTTIELRGFDRQINVDTDPVRADILAAGLHYILTGVQGEDLPRFVTHTVPAEDTVPDEGARLTLSRREWLSAAGVTTILGLSAARPVNVIRSIDVLRSNRLSDYLVRVSAKTDYSAPLTQDEKTFIVQSVVRALLAASPADRQKLIPLLGVSGLRVIQPRDDRGSWTLSLLGPTASAPTEILAVIPDLQKFGADLKAQDALNLPSASTMEKAREIIAFDKMEFLKAKMAFPIKLGEAAPDGFEIDAGSLAGVTDLARFEAKASWLVSGGNNFIGSLNSRHPNFQIFITDRLQRLSPEQLSIFQSLTKSLGAANRGVVVGPVAADKKLVMRVLGQNVLDADLPDLQDKKSFKLSMEDSDNDSLEKWSWIFQYGFALGQSLAANHFKNGVLEFEEAKRNPKAVEPFIGPFNELLSGEKLDPSQPGTFIDLLSGRISLLQKYRLRLEGIFKIDFDAQVAGARMALAQTGRSA